MTHIFHKFFEFISNETKTKSWISFYIDFVLIFFEAITNFIF